MRRMNRFEAALELTDRVVSSIRPHARPLEDLDPLIERIGDARYVLLGEASHGTSQFYAMRTEITRRLVREKGFRFVAVEGDWPDCFRVNRYVKSGGGSARATLHAFDRWPTWMWANCEVEELIEWLREHNDGRAEDDKVGFYGLDVYSLWESMRAVIEYLDRHDATAAKAARRAYECFAAYSEDAQEYARATVIVPASCEEAVVASLAKLRARAPVYREQGRESYFDAEQNALTAKNAEHYYRTLVRCGSASWNIRDQHMVQTLERLMDFHGKDAKAIVWAHNTHVGDARFTDMAAEGEVNLGQLLRERRAKDGVVLVGFGTYRGTVIAGDAWGAPMRRMTVPEGRRGSYEDVMHRIGDSLVVMSELPALPELLEPRGHRAIGVVYRPQFERFGNYVPTVLPKRYDAMLFVDETSAVRPLHMPESREPEVAETYPTGM